MPLLDDFDIVVCRRTFKRYTSTANWFVVLSLVAAGDVRVELFDPGSTKCRRRTLIEEIPLSSRGVFAEAER
ncbi:MAG: hypothetical protein CM1200mP2_49020 [Planctomycetaceae bacterium]|nr:MAG: hypothetical protein CM1200mP2_49020 [Planctomycetaceae bacterium]